MQVKLQVLLHFDKENLHKSQVGVDEGDEIAAITLHSLMKKKFKAKCGWTKTVTQ